MAISNIIEVGLGLAVAYYVLGLMVSFISARILEKLDTRSKIFNEYLYSILEDGQILDYDAATRNRLASGSDRLREYLELRQIKALAPIWYRRFWNIFGVDTEKKKVTKIPPDILLETLFDYFDLNNLDELTPEQVKAKLESLPENSSLRQELETLYDRGVSRVDELRQNASRWADNVMAQASEQYKANARAWVIVLAVVVTLLTGLDSIEYGLDLWNNPQRREVATARAAAALQAEGQDTDFDALLADVEALNMKIGWWAIPENRPVADAAAGMQARYWVLKVIGLIITAIAVAQGSSFWYDSLKRFSSTSGSSSGKT